MKKLPIDATDAAVLAAIKEWVELLIKEDYVEANNFLLHEEGEADFWTAELIAQQIHTYDGYSVDGTIYKVTSLDEARNGPRPRHNVQREEDYPEGYVWFDLSLNGKWSDLTAVLDVQLADNEPGLNLRGIHVM